MPESRPASNPQILYFDNAATSFPKPPAVAEAMREFLAEMAVNPGRSGFDLSLAAGRLVDRVRHKLDRLFNNPAQDPGRCVFALNATAALNLAIQGGCRPGDHVVATVMEHNSVLRPLHEMTRRGIISHDLAGCDARGRVSPSEVARLLRPETRLVIINHASNVCGRVQPVGEIGRLCRERGILLLLDAAQTAGVIPVDMTGMQLDMVAFTGHKGLLGPTGTGGLLVGPRVEIGSTQWGGTGVRSAELAHPQDFPYRLEAGTLNTVGLAGLEAGLDHLARREPGAIARHERQMAELFLEAVATLPGLHIPGLAAPGDPLPTTLPDDQLAVLSVVLDGLSPDKLGLFLDAEHEVAVRTGLHCAPLAHRALGTAPDGTVRFSFGPFNTPEQVELAARALRHLAG